MSMKVHTEGYVPFLVEGAYPFFKVKYLRVKKSWRLFPTTVKVYSSYIASEIAIDDSINVDHGKYLDHEVL